MFVITMLLSCLALSAAACSKFTIDRILTSMLILLGSLKTLTLTLRFQLHFLPLPIQLVDMADGQKAGKMLSLNRCKLRHSVSTQGTVQSASPVIVIVQMPIHCTVDGMPVTPWSTLVSLWSSSETLITNYRP